MKETTNNPEIRQFIRENASLFWYTPEEKKEEISLELLVETILNYGDLTSVKKLFDLLGLDTVADIFYRQTSGKRTNYFPQVAHYFDEYFKRHAHRNTHRQPDRITPSY